MTDTTLDMTTVLKALVKSGENADKAKLAGSSALGDLLKVLQEAEKQGSNVNAQKREAFSVNGWTYKEYDQTLDKFITIDGDKAPAKVSTAFSEAKRALIQEGSILGFQTWEEMRKACKPVDTLIDVKLAQKRVNKALKAINLNDWNDYATGSIEKLADELEKLIK